MGETGGGTRDGRPPLTRWWPLLGLGLVGVIVVAVVLHPRTPLSIPVPKVVPTTRSSPQTRGPVGATSVPLVTRAAGPAPVVVDLHHSVLGVTAGWELFARSDDSVIRIEAARGRVTRTGVPSLASSGPVSFLAGPEGVIVRPLDYVPGYEVPDGAPARALPGVLAVGGPALPGPDRDHLWTQARRGSGALTLTDWAGHPSAVTAAAPADSSVVSAASDGAGQILFFSGERGVFLGGTSRTRLLTGGTLDAINARTMVVTKCDPDVSCVTSVVDRMTSRRKALAHAVASSMGAGLVSPDNRRAVMVTPGADTSSSMELTLLDLGDGTRTTLPRSLGIPDATRMVFSPDGRWLFIATDEGRIAAVDPLTGRITDLGIALPAVRQLAVRPGRA
ncbi:hypothetical protein SAMN04515671_3295 [Nakamurella panacisegetis]|uniref:WD40-like Beta Propeller Repeat n=1 Tax=Nakamurella panacisegetis TaxID=1090615 RepID=A0A1H0QX74_9ACTN|nr:hypothetical protein [Nakamurella panacisegetis]SDP21857.1 hypothetical protein SAMN04515671_3295 [Nakamurella panacisegetis]